MRLGVVSRRSSVGVKADPWQALIKKKFEVMKKNCIFCKIVAKEIPTTVVHETDDILVIKDINPKASTHYLIMPKKHIADIQSFEPQDLPLAGKLFEVAKELAKKAGDFKLVVNSGAKAGQEVFHVHLHFLAGKKAELV